MMFTNILVPFDKSEHALRALEVAKGFAAEDPTVRLHVLSAIYAAMKPMDLGVDAGYVLDTGTYDKLLSAGMTREKAEVKEAIGDMLDDLPNPVAFEVVNSMDVAKSIGDYAAEHACDLIIMGARGLGRLRGMIGSVSYGVLRTSDVPVLIVKDGD